VIFRVCLERWLASCQFIGEATQSPNVYLLCVEGAIHDLWRNPGWSAALRLSVLLLFAQEYAETKISQFDLTIGSDQNVVRLDVSVQDIFVVHFLQTRGNLKEGPLAEPSRQFSSSR